MPLILGLISCRYPDICPCLNILPLSGYLPAPQYPAAIRIFARASISCCYPDICPRLNILPLSGYLSMPQYPAAIRIPLKKLINPAINLHSVRDVPIRVGRLPFVYSVYSLDRNVFPPISKANGRGTMHFTLLTIYFVFTVICK